MDLSEVTNQELAAELLRRVPFGVVAVAWGDETLEAACKGHPAVVVGVCRKIMHQQSKAMKLKKIED